MSTRDDPLFLQKTLVPILLTLGVLLNAGGVAMLLAGQDNPILELLPTWAMAVCLLGGIAMISLGLFNVFYIKSAMSESSRGR